MISLIALRDKIFANTLNDKTLTCDLNLKKKKTKNTNDYNELINLIIFSIQGLEQERHLLRRKLEEARGESEARTLELQGDLESLRSQLEEQSERARRAERDQANLVNELTAQNARLADQLREAAKQEEQLLVELKLLREKCALRSTTLQDHVSSLEVLKDEVGWANFQHNCISSSKDTVFNRGGVLKLVE